MERKYKRIDCEIKNGAGEVIFRHSNVEVPEHWSQVACNIMVEKYFRKSGVPDMAEIQLEGNILPEFCPSKPHAEATFGGETSAKQVFHRLAGAWAYWGLMQGHIINEEAHRFYEKTVDMLFNQKFAPNSPQWFNTGLDWAYGITGPTQGHYHAALKGDVGVELGTIIQSVNAYTRPQASACFIQGVSDSLIKDNGIMDLVSKEARLFKYGSGSGTNFSNIRGKGEALSGGGKSSGLMSFLKIGDVSAGSIKSGGTTRRAAKMVSLDDDHPDIEDFINWKVGEEDKVASLAAGSALIHQHLYKMQEDFGKPQFQATVFAAKEAGVPDGLIERALLALDQGINISVDVIGTDWQSEAYMTVSGQNANNTIRVSDQFLEAADGITEYDRKWDLISRTTGDAVKTVCARDLLDQAAYAAWASADPGIHYADVIDKWHTCKNDGRIKGSNPCSEYIFLDDTACNLASLNLVNYTDKDGNFDLEKYAEDCRHVTMILDITVGMAQYPTEAIAQGSWDYRTIGLGYANIGGLLMRWGIPYDSDEGRFVAGVLYSIMTASAYLEGAKMARNLGPFPRYEANKSSVLGVMHKHRAASEAEAFFEGECIPLPRIDLDHDLSTGTGGRFLQDARAMQEAIWERVCVNAQDYGLRNAQATVAAPTGTIGLVMDCDTMGIEPDFALTKFKSLAGGGFVTLVNQAVEPALKHLGYPAETRNVIQEQILQGIPLGDIGDLHPSHISVFHCANEISYEGHMKMLSVCQPFVSGSLSKTVNLPATATVAEIKEIFLFGRKIGLKALSVYRDKSKLSQPLSSSSKVMTMLAQMENMENMESNEKGSEIRVDEEKDQFIFEDKVPDPVSDAALAQAMEMTMGQRVRLPNERNGHTVKLIVSGHKFYLRTGEYADGRLGEIFITMYKEGTLIGSLLNNFAISISLGLQYGVPLEEYVDAYVHTKFEPAGMVQGHENIKMCSSILDAAFKHLAMRYLNRYDLAQVKRYVGVDEAGPDRDYTAIQVWDPKAKDDNLARLNRKLDLEAAAQRSAEAADKPAPFAGDQCKHCQSHELVHNGNCLLCRACGETTGCS